MSIEYVEALKTLIATRKAVIEAQQILIDVLKAGVQS